MTRRPSMVSLCISLMSALSLESMMLGSPSEARSWRRMALATCQPWPRAPTICCLGTRTSVKKTSLKLAVPVMSTRGRISMPGVSMRNSKKEMP